MVAEPPGWPPGKVPSNLFEEGLWDGLKGNRQNPPADWRLYEHPEGPEAHPYMRGYAEGQRARNSKEVGDGR